MTSARSDTCDRLLMRLVGLRNLREKRVDVLRPSVANVRRRNAVGVTPSLEAMFRVHLRLSVSHAGSINVPIARNAMILLT